MKKQILCLLLLALSFINVNAQTAADLDKWFPDPVTMAKNDTFSIKQISVKNRDGLKIYGVAYIPNGAKGQRYPTVIFSHGFSSSHRFHSRYGIAFAKAGIACYTFDFCGGSAMSKSEGKMEDMSVVTERNDLEDVFQAARTWSWVDTNNMFLCGESQGGFVSAFAGVDLQEELRGIMLLYPAFHIPVAMWKAFPDPSKAEYKKEAFGSVKCGKKYVLDAQAQNTTDICRSFYKPVLIIHGDSDRLVDVTYAYQAKKDYPNAELKIIKDADHGFFMPSQGEQAAKWMIEWVKAQAK